MHSTQKLLQRAHWIGCSDPLKFEQFKDYLPRPLAQMIRTHMREYFSSARFAEERHNSGYGQQIAEVVSVRRRHGASLF
jgi:hypothetical protein